MKQLSVDVKMERGKGIKKGKVSSKKVQMEVEHLNWQFSVYFLATVIFVGAYWRSLRLEWEKSLFLDGKVVLKGTGSYYDSKMAFYCFLGSEMASFYTKDS